MAKDAYWFKHDSTAGRGLRMRKMAHIYSHWGKGVYWDVIEILRDQSNYCFDSDDSSLQMLADLIGCKDESKFLSWFRDCIKFELFIIQENKFFSEVLCINMEIWESKKGNGSKGGRPKKTETITETITELKPNIKANRNHNRIEDNIIENNIEERKLKFASTLKPFLDKYGKEMIRAFYDHWTEPNKSNTKFRQELEKTWGLEKRLNTWKNNDTNFKPKQKQQIYNHDSNGLI